MLDSLISISICLSTNDNISELKDGTYAVHGGYINFKNGNYLWLIKDSEAVQRALESIGYTRLENIWVRTINTTDLFSYLEKEGPKGRYYRIANAFECSKEFRERFRNMKSPYELRRYIDEIKDTPDFSLWGTGYELTEDGKWAQQMYEDIMTRKKAEENKQSSSRSGR